MINERPRRRPPTPRELRIPIHRELRPYFEDAHPWIRTDLFRWLAHGSWSERAVAYIRTRDVPAGLLRKAGL